MLIPQQHTTTTIWGTTNNTNNAGDREGETSLPQDPKADPVQRKKQLDAKKKDYEWSTEVVPQCVVRAGGSSLLFFSSHTAIVLDNSSEWRQLAAILTAYTTPRGGMNKRVPGNDV